MSAPSSWEALGDTRAGDKVSGQPQGLEGEGHSLHFGCAAGLTLEADIICGEDDHAPWGLFRDDRGLHHWGQDGDSGGEDGLLRGEGSRVWSLIGPHGNGVARREGRSLARSCWGKCGTRQDRERTALKVTEKETRGER